jgi:transposase
MDISKKDAKVCVRIAGAGRRKTVETVTTWGSMTSQILSLHDHLLAEHVTCVVMEATGDCWKPFYYLLEDLPGVELLLVNARHVKNLPGRKTDVADSTWLAQLGAHGLVKGSFVPPEPIRQLRDLTRARTAITRERAREAQRLEKLLEDAGIKLSAVASDILGVSGRAMLEALIAGDRDPTALADLAKRRLRSKIPELIEALYGRFNEHHAFLARVHLDLIDRHTAAINQLTERIEAVIEPFQGPRTHLLHPRDQHPDRRRDRCRDRCRHEQIPDRQAPRVLGWHHPRKQRVSRQGEIQPHPTREPLPSRRPRGCCHVVRTEPADLPRCPIPADLIPARSAEGQRRDPALDPHRDLAHGQHRGPLRRPRRGLLHPDQPRASPHPSHPPTPSHGLPSHPRYRLLNRSPLTSRGESSRQRPVTRSG